MAAQAITYATIDIVVASNSDVATDDALLPVAPVHLWHVFQLLQCSTMLPRSSVQVLKSTSIVSVQHPAESFVMHVR